MEVFRPGATSRWVLRLPATACGGMSDSSAETPRGLLRDTVSVELKVATLHAATPLGLVPITSRFINSRFVAVARAWSSCLLANPGPPGRSLARTRRRPRVASTCRGRLAPVVCS